MSKKKKKLKKEDMASLVNKSEEYSVLKDVDENILKQYREITSDIEDYQYQVYLADRKTERKFRKAKKKGKKFDFDKSASVKVRLGIVKDLEEKDSLGKINQFIKDCIPIARILARCVVLMIMAIISREAVKAAIKPETLELLNGIMQTALSL